MAFYVERPPFLRADVPYEPFWVGTAKILLSDEATVAESNIAVSTWGTGRYYIDVDGYGLVPGSKYFVQFQYRPLNGSPIYTTNVGFKYGGSTFHVERPPFLQADVIYDPYWVGAAKILASDEATVVVASATVTKRATGRYYIDYGGAGLTADTKYYVQFQYKPFSDSPIQTTNVGATYQGITGTLDFLMPLFVMDLEGVSDAGNSINFVLPMFDMSLEGTVTAAPGELNFTLPMFKMALTGHVDSSGTLNFELPMFTINLYGENGTQEYKAVVLNTETMAITEYDNFPFNSFCEHKGQIYGATDDGIYLLEGEDDAGEDIDAYYKTAITDFGTSNLKRISDIIARFKGDNLRVSVVDDREYVQTAETLTGHAPTGIHTERAKPGKGMKSKAFGLDVENVYGKEITPLELEMRLLLLEKKA